MRRRSTLGHIVDLPLRDLLFKCELINGEPLFTGVAALSQAIGKIDPAFALRAASVAAALHAILNGRREFPRKLRGAFLAAVTDRLEAVGDRRIRRELQEAVRAKSVDSRTPTQFIPACTRPDFTAVLKASQTSLDALVLVPGKLLFSKCAAPLRGQLIKRLALYQGADPVAPPKFTFYFADESEALDFWKELIAEAATANPVGGNLARHEVTSRLASLADQKHLVVRVLSEAVLMANAIIFNSEAFSPSGFNMYLAGDDTVSLCPMPEEDVKRWLEHFARYMDANPEKSFVVHVPKSSATLL